MINWNNTKEVVELLEEIFPNEDLDDIELSDIKERLTELTGLTEPTEYDPIPPDWNEERLNEILEGWQALRENL